MTRTLESPRRDAPREEAPQPAVELEPLQVPDRVEVKDGRLLWVFKRAPERQLVQVPRKLLDRFLALRWPDVPPGLPAHYRQLYGGRRVPSAVTARYAPLGEDKVLTFAREF